MHYSNTAYLENCTIMTWDEDNLEDEPTLNETRKKSSVLNSLERNCVFPNLVEHPTTSNTVVLNAITEYYGSDPFTGFVSVQLDATNYHFNLNPDTGTNAWTEKRITDQ
jgi:hypothetical protein